ncbi:MAG: NAD(P)H-dependent oxidoreductase [Rhodothermales bacterium]|nr:NAD(P)H-dependent oxidoreductase [Rhodothermales bacterium]
MQVVETPFSVVAISGSLRDESHNTRILKAARSIAPYGMEIRVTDISDVPMYNDDIFKQGFPSSVDRLRWEIESADAVLIATPEYNSSIPGVLKNTLDWISRPPNQPFNEKPVAILGGSPGRLGTVRAQAHLREVLNGMSAYVLPKPEVFIGQVSDAVGEDSFRDERTAQFVTRLLESLRAWARSLQAVAVQST